MSPSSSAQAAREAVAARLRHLRKTAGFTVADLGRQCGWNGAKTSRIENAVTAPSVRDIRAWCQATGAIDQVEGLVA
ncbi:helix-turn-helix domain-containing protein [Streptomyces sp. NPDC056910]|uniref:helix-turn-helix domain-containing protein n=1 Tax=Streptomyces sp. NPDC056910 TaxID=3345964 RepID=UPI003675DFF2